MTRPLILATACVTALASQASDDETRFRSKSYAPRQSLSETAYREAAYTPSATSQSTGKRVEAPSAPSRWRLFSSDKKLDDSKRLADSPAAHEAAYKQEKQISVATLKADARDAPEQKPFVTSDKKLTDTNYQAKESSHTKDPMLAPRQGIKAPE